MKKIFIILAVIGLVACKSNSPSAYRGLPKEYNLAYQEIYGHCYDSVPYAVVALDLYSEGITLNNEHRIQGTGYNLYLSDIFVPDSLLAQGEYKSITNDQLPIPYTFLPGRDYEGTPHGMYILDIQDDKIANIQVLDSGSLVFKGDSLLFTLYYTNSYGSRITYTCHFAGGLIPWPKR